MQLTADIDNWPSHNGIEVHLTELSEHESGYKETDSIISVIAARPGVLLQDQMFKFCLEIPANCGFTYIGQTIKHRWLLLVVSNILFADFLYKSASLAC